MFFEIDVLKNFAILKTTMLQCHFNKVTGLQICKFIKKRLQHRCFPKNIAKFLRIYFLTEHLRWLLPIIEPLLFLVHNNYLPECLNTVIKLLADDT